jgi:predicted metalloprotease with PDZ domain
MEVLDVRSFARFSVVLALAAIFALPVLAGEEGKKCEHDAQACLKKMAEMFQDRGWVGIEYDENEEGAMYVTHVVPESPAAAAGFKESDLLVALNGVKFAEASEEQLKETQKAMTVGAKVTYTLLRDGSEVEVHPVLAKLPEDVMAQWIGMHMLKGHVDLASAETAE